MLEWLRPLRRGAKKSGDPFRESPYYEMAEPRIDDLWNRVIWPRIEGMDFTRVVDLAAGYGRNTAKLLAVARELIVVDINETCVDACRARFGADPRVRYLLTNGYSLRGIEDGSVTLVYSFDSMVHFEPAVVAAYLREIGRVLADRGCAFLHHSNYGEQPRGGFRRAPHWRNYMTLELFTRYAEEASLELVASDALDWGEGDTRCASLDRLSIVRRAPAWNSR
jgi:SAM-dependent methyltransferase